MPRERLRGAPNLAALTTAVTVVALDAVTKAWARGALDRRAIHVIGFVWLRLQYNAGVSFSLNSSGPIVTTVVTAAIAVAVLVASVFAQRGWPAYGFGLLLGGGVANVVDRFAASPHQVTDFIAVGSFPVFNLADVAVTAGFAVLIVVTLRGGTLMRR